MIKETFLLEIGTEELPPKNLNILAQSLACNLSNKFKDSNLTHGNVYWFTTPRRLAVKIKNLIINQPTSLVKKIGPHISIAFDNKGNLTEIAEKWAFKNNINLLQKKFFKINENKKIFYSEYVEGKKTQDIIPGIINNVLKKLNIVNLMRWGDGNIKFIRPVHTVTLLLGNKLISAIILGIKTSRVILGHRFMGSKIIKLNNADQYPYILQNYGNVIADYNIRKQKIKSDIEECALKLNGKIDLSSNLLDEVTSLVEWPVVLVGKFDKNFLHLPKEVLVHIMECNQKYFPVYDNNGSLLPYFIFITNIESNNANKIIKGNEKIIFPRFSDAKNFFEKDRIKKLETNLLLLKNIIFQQKLGTLIEKTYRIQKLSCYISIHINANIKKTYRAALLAKCDLVTNMVFEFPEVQGIMGMHYAIDQGEKKDIAIAIQEQYLPRFSKDNLPTTLIGSALAIADKIDTIVGFIGIDKHPKNNKDPFALKRSAIGILNIIIEKKLSIDLKNLIKKSICLYKEKLTNLTVFHDVINFLSNRLVYLYRKKNYNMNIIQSVLAVNMTVPLDFDLRIKAIFSYCSYKKLEELIIINKRITNIINQSREKLDNNINYTLLKEKEELQLANSIMYLKEKVHFYLINFSYKEYLIELSKLNNIINVFFDKVMINCNDKSIRINRLNLISNLRILFLKIADFSLM